MPLRLNLRFLPRGFDRSGHALFDIIAELPQVPNASGTLSGLTHTSLFHECSHTLHLNAVPDDVRVQMGPSPKRVRASVTRQERTVAESLGGHRQTGSGARPRHKGDGRVEGKFRIENKMTRTESIRVPLSDLRKIRAECSPGEVPIYEVQFRDKHTLAVKEQWALVPWSEWEKRVREANDDR